MARALVARAAAAVPGRDLMLDVPTAAPGWMAALRRRSACASSARSRACTARAPGRPAGPSSTFAAFGPELG